MNILRIQGMNEIGSEFWDVPTSGRKCEIWSNGITNIQWYLCGRSALQAIVKELNNAKSVAMPSWCCHTMIKPFIDAGIEVEFYSVSMKDGTFVQEWNKKSDALFLLDYFGYSGELPDLQDYHGVVIRDVTHSIFSKTYGDADYYFGSLRKWCGVWTGGYAWGKDGHKLHIGDGDDKGYVLLRERAMQLKNSYIHGYTDANGITVEDKGYLDLFESAEEKLEDIGILPAEKRDVQAANGLDLSYIRARRRENAECLRGALKQFLIFPEMAEDDVPLFVPIIVPDGKRNALRKYLTKYDVYCPIHWSVSRYHRLNEREQYIYDNELSLVCDQRYKTGDMRRMIDLIQVFLKMEA